MSVEYECLRCHAISTQEDLEYRAAIKCIICGYRVLKKTKPPVVKRVKCI